MQSKLKELTGFKKILANRAVNAKLANLEKSGSVTHSVYDRLVFNKFRDVVGGRVTKMVTGSAPISKDVLNFLKIAFCCPIYEGYGQTETAAAATITCYGDPETGHVGGPVSSIEIKLVDVPEMNYTSKDVVNGKPHPRGEICFRGNNVFVGYYNAPEKNAEAFDEDGWLHSGDIGMIYPNGAVKIIDRKKNIFKLAQGEYIAPEKLENVFNKSPIAMQTFIYGDSL